MNKRTATWIIAASLIAGGSGTAGLAAGFHLGQDQAQGVGRCPAEDSCSVDYVGDPDGNGRWVVNTLPGDDSQGCHWEWYEDGSGVHYCGGVESGTRPAGTFGDG